MKYFSIIGLLLGGLLLLTQPEQRVDARGLVSNSDFLVEVAKGNVPNHSIVNKFGANDAVGTSFVPISGGGVFATPSTITALEVLSSDNTNDIPAGTGARSVYIEGLGAGWVMVGETLALNGTTAVPTVNSYFRITRMYVVTSGAYASTAGASHNSTLTLRVAGAGASWAIIAPEGGFGLGQTEIGIYSVPDGSICYLISTHIDVEGAKVVDVLLYRREDADTVSAPYSAMKVLNVKRNVEGEHGVNGSPLATIIGPADIGYMGKISSGTAKVEVEFKLLCISNYN